MRYREPVYVHLFEGHDHPEADAAKTGSDGPTFASGGNIIFTPEAIKFIEWNTGELRVLRIVEGCAYYDNVYFRSCSVAASVEEPPIPFDPGLADWSRRQNRPPGSRHARKHRGKYAQLSDKDRFEKVASLLEGCIEDRLSLLRTADESERDYLLTSDIDDQIGHWEWISHELIELKSAG
jgi:hypothetical protein